MTVFGHSTATVIGVGVSCFAGGLVIGDQFQPITRTINAAKRWSAERDADKALQRALQLAQLEAAEAQARLSAQVEAVAAERQPAAATA
jgi:DNA-directed RNA polymerase subunit N (RpoN/RPB10)